jgi:competence protein ComEC
VPERPPPVAPGDLGVVAVAAGAWLGAAVPLAVPVPVLALAGGLALVSALGRDAPVRVVVVAVAVAVVTAGLGARSLDGLRPVSEGPFEGVAVLVTDPDLTPQGRIRVDVRVQGRRLLAEARTPGAVDALVDRLAGERVSLRGEISAFDSPMGWAQARHLAGRLRIESVLAVGPAAPHAAAANGLRRTLDRGAASLPDRHRSLLAGLTLGDERDQPPEMTADFRASGLTHLLAVSGSNVVFVLAVAGPLLRRLRLWPRFFVAVVVVVGFAFLTRFEPSVVRATAMAVVALWASTTGRGSGGLRHLALAVTGLLLVDPLLARSVGFQLSVAACSGVLLLSPSLIPRIPGPGWVRDALGMTIAAQLAVAPVLVPTFGAMPLASLPANVAAVPLAAGLMVWGITAGVVAGVVGGPVAAVLHVPSGIGLVAMEQIAAWSAALPLGMVDLRHVVVVTLAAVLVAAGGRRRLAGAALVVAVLAVPAGIPVPPGAEAAGWGATVWSDRAVAVVELRAGASAIDVLDVLRQRRVRVVGLVVVTSSSPHLDEVVRAVRARFDVRGVVAPRGSPVADHLVPAPGSVLRVAGFQVQVDAVEPRLRTRVGWAGAEAPAGRR